MNHTSHLHPHLAEGDFTEHFVDGEHLSTITKNTLGGNDFHAHGHLEARTMPNPAGGYDVHHNGHIEARTTPNPAGGYDVHRNGHLEARVMPNPAGGLDVHNNGHLVASTIPMGHGFTTVIHHNDPLMHVQDYFMDPLVL